MLRSLKTSSLRRRAYRPFSPRLSDEYTISTSPIRDYPGPLVHSHSGRWAAPPRHPKDVAVNSQKCTPQRRHGALKAALYRTKTSKKSPQENLRSRNAAPNGARTRTNGWKNAQIHGGSISARKYDGLIISVQKVRGLLCRTLREVLVGQASFDRSFGKNLPARVGVDGGEARSRHRP